jgi:hypothetical protein
MKAIVQDKYCSADVLELKDIDKPVVRRNRGEAKRRSGPRRISAQQERDRAGAGRGCGLS